MCICVYIWLIGRDRDIDLPVDEAIVDVIAPFKDTKEPVEMTIGVGMEFTIPGRHKQFFKKYIFFNIMVLYL